MKKLIVILSAALIFALALAGCGKKEEVIAPTDVVEEEPNIIEATDQRVVTDPDEIEQMIIEYGIPMEAESIGTIVETRIDASVFD